VKPSLSEVSSALLQEPPTGSIAVRVTDATRKFGVAPSLNWRSAAGASLKSEAITLDPGKTSQKYLGIGGAFTDAACYMFNQLSVSAREQLFHEMFDPSEMGLSVGRICIGSSDYSTKVYSYDEGEPDPELKRFSIEQDRTYILPILRQARRANPNLFLLASPWSPPGWMKPNGSMLGGCMRQSTMPAYANYFLKFLQAYEADGVRINAVTSQNEVDTEQDGRMPACAWPQEYEISFVRDFLGPVLRKNGVETKIWLLDHNYNLWGRAICCLDDRGLRDFSNSVAWHGYVGVPEMVTKVHEAHPDAECSGQKVVRTCRRKTTRRIGATGVRPSPASFATGAARSSVGTWRWMSWADQTSVPSTVPALLLSTRRPRRLLAVATSGR